MANLYDIYNTFSSGFGGVNKKLVYPLENQSDYLGKITFTPINEESRVNMAEGAESLVSVVKEQIKEFGKLIGDAVSYKDDNEQASTHQSVHQDAKDTESIKLAKAVKDNAKSSFYGKPKAAPAFSDRSLSLNTD